MDGLRNSNALHKGVFEAAYRAGTSVALTTCVAAGAPPHADLPVRYSLAALQVARECVRFSADWAACHRAGRGSVASGSVQGTIAPHGAPRGTRRYLVSPPRPWLCFLRHCCVCIDRGEHSASGRQGQPDLAN